MNYYWLGTRLPEYEMDRPDTIHPSDMRPTISNVTSWVGRSVHISVNTWNPSALYLERSATDTDGMEGNTLPAKFGGEAETLLENSRKNGESVLACVFTCDFCGDASLGVVTDFDGAADPHFFRRGDQGTWVGGDVPDSMNRQIKSLRAAIGHSMLDAYRLPASTWGPGK